jgi:hypothetical protein
MDDDLESKTRAEIVALAKDNGIKANGKTAAMIEALRAIGTVIPVRKSAKVAKKTAPAERGSDNGAAGGNQQVLASMADSLESKTRAEIVALAKATGIKANGKTAAMIEALRRAVGPGGSDFIAPGSAAAGPQDSAAETAKLKAEEEAAAEAAKLKAETEAAAEAAKLKATGKMDAEKEAAAAPLLTTTSSGQQVLEEVARAIDDSPQDVVGIQSCRSCTH